MRCTVPVVTIAARDVTLDLSFDIAILACRHSYSGAVLGLCLRPIPRVDKDDYTIYSTVLELKRLEGSNVHSDNRQIVGRIARLLMFPTTVRLCQNVHNTTHPRFEARKKYKTIHLLHRGQSKVIQQFAFPAADPNLDCTAFAFSKWTLAEIKSRGFSFEDDKSMNRPSIVAFDASHDYSKESVCFTNRISGERFVITLGRCKSCFLRESDLAGTIRIYIIPPFVIPGTNLPVSDPCSLDIHHFSRWKNWTKTFGDTKRSIQISLTYQPFNGLEHPDEICNTQYLMVHIKLAGAIYGRYGKSM